MRSALLSALLAAVAAARTLLLLDPTALSSAANVTVAPGAPSLLALYPGGIGGGAYAGWAYPCVVAGALANGSAGYLMLYSASSCSAPGCWGREPLYTFLAESLDGVAWAPVAVPTAPPGAPPGALFASSEVGAVVDDEGGQGVGAGERYKLLRPDGSIDVSGDARAWAPWGHRWTSVPVDPGFHALRGARGGSAVLVTARPQALRAQGRHAGVIYAPGGWQGLGAQAATPTAPLDAALYRFTQQIYGLPAFDYGAVLGADAALPPALRADDGGGNYVAFAWRLLAADGETGSVSAALAHSRDGRAWAPAPSAPAPVPALAPESDLPGSTYATLLNGSSASLSPAACASACDGDSASCSAWAHVSPGAGLGAGRCELKREALGAPVAARGVTCGLRAALAAQGSAPLPALPAILPLPTAPSAAAYRQLYPKSLLAARGRLLLYASVSSTLHGASAPNASGIAVYELRADGLAGAAGPAAGAGLLVTAPLEWAGGEAALNVLCGAAGGGGGGVRVGVLQGGAPLPGYTLAQAVPAPRGCDALDWAPAWGGGGSGGLAALAGLTVQLQVELSGGAQLFAVRGNFSRCAKPRWR